MSGTETVIVSQAEQGQYTNSIITSSGHNMTADEPLSVGGLDLGPSPYDFLLSALGSCKSMTMRMYASRKGFKLDHVEVKLSHSKIHAEDCENCETKKGLVDHIQTDISLKGDLTDEERQKIFDIAARCPVHRTITHEIIIESSLR